jgi:3-dehydroquinate synthetase
MEFRALVGCMAGDKKNRGHQIRFALPAEVGHMHRVDGWTMPVSEDLILEGLALIQ